MKKLIDRLFTESIVTAFLNFVIRWRYLVLLLTFLLSGASFWVARSIGIDSSIIALLPKHTPSVVQVKEMEKKIGGQGDLIVMIESADKISNIIYVEKLLFEIRKLQWVDQADYKINDSVFVSKKLLYCDTNDLIEIRDRVNAYIKNKKESYNPFLVNLMDEKPAVTTLDFSDIEKKYTNADGYRKENISSDGTMVLVVIRPHGLTSNISFARKIYSDVKNVVSRFDIEANEKNIRVSIGGTYKNRLDEYETIISDLKSGTILAFCAIIVLIVIYFRSVSIMFCVIFPLIMSELWTFAITRLIIGDLNLITAFLIIILFGLGIDFGVHILNRYMIGRRSGMNNFDALRESLQKSARASLTSALTIIVSFYMLIFSDFLGFRHFGFIAGTGILLAYIGYMVLCPVFVTIIDDVSRGRLFKSRHCKVGTNETIALHTKSSLSKKTAAISLVVLTVLTMISIWQMLHVSFEYDFRNLRSQVKSTREFNKKVASVFTTARDPAAIMVSDENEAREIEQYLRNAQMRDTISPLEGIKSLGSLIPSDQQRKIEIIKEIRQIVDKNISYNAEGKEGNGEIQSMRNLLIDSPITIKDIPEEIVEMFLGRDSTTGQVMYLYQRYSLLDLHNAQKFAQAVGTINVNGKAFHAISEPLVYLDLVNLLKRDSVIAIIGALIIIVGIIFLDFGSIRATLMVLTPLFIGLFWMFGLMHLFSLKLNIFNMVILPSILGLGIDACVQVYHHLQEEWGMPFWKLLVRIGGPNILCTSINLIGFGGIVTAFHPGLRSIGQLAIIGMSTCLVSALAFLPVMMALFKRGRING